MTDAENPENASGLKVTRRGALMGGALGIAAVAGVSEADPQVALAAIPTSTVPLPTGTAPEQLRLAWGADPTTQVTISFSPPGSTQMPAPTLAYSTSPISLEHPGTIVTLPAPTPLNQTQLRTGPTSTSFTDGLSQQTTYHYHVPLTGLSPNTRYFYVASDGAGASAGGEFVTAPTGRAAYRFTAFGDIGTPTTGNPSGYTWTESSDVSEYTVDGVLSPGDDDGAGLFHLMLADLSYANVNPANGPQIWRDYQYNVSRLQQNQPWMPIQGNHEVEYGLTNVDGGPRADPNNPASTEWYNGPFGTGPYLARHLLPDNGLTNYDGNRLQGTFYSFQVGTVLFVCLNTNDVVYQNPQLVSTTTAGKNYAGTYNGGTLPQGTGVGQFQVTGKLTPGGTGIQLVPDTASGIPNLQTQWLETTLAAARAAGSSVDMIVVCEHHCALSTGPNNGVDLAIRAAWLPLYDEYEVDLVIGGHDHDYERSYPVRGYDAPSGTASATFTNPWGSYASGATIDTRRPSVVTTEPTLLGNGLDAWDTAGGTVFLQLGGAGAAAGNLPTAGKTTPRQAEIWAVDTGVGAKQCAVEDAPWSAYYDTTDNYGYAVFDVDPGEGPGDTSLTYRWFAVPPISSTPEMLPSSPLEEFVFKRFMPAGAVSIAGANNGSIQAGGTLTATPSGFASGAAYAYQWLRNGSPISGATSASYTTVAADGGTKLTVGVVASAQSYPASTITSSAVAVTAAPASPAPSSPSTTPSAPSTPSAPTPSPLVTNPSPVSLSIPAVSGTKRVGGTLTATAAVANPFYATVTYQWLRDGRAIPGATKQTYELVADDAGQFVRVRATASVAADTVSVESAAAAIAGEPFAKTAKPRIAGTALVGHTVTADIAAWSPAASFTYQWLLAGRVIAGATRKTLKLESSYAGKRVTVRVTGTRSGYASREIVSAPVVVARSAVKAVRPQISGKTLVGDTLHAHTGQWPAGTEFGYRWFVNGWEVPGATGHSFRLLPEYRGKRVALEVTGRLAGHESVRAVSAQTRAVRRPWTLL